MKSLFHKIKSIFQQNKLLKTLMIVVGVIILFVAIAIIFISPITKYLIEKYDEKYTGRQIEMDLAYVNPFTGYIHLKNLKIFEFNKDTVFFSADALNINVELFKILSKTHEISDLTIKRPRAQLIQNNKELNLNDLIEKFSSKDTLEIKKEAVHLNLLNVKIVDGEFYFHENTIPVNYNIIKVNIETDGYRWNSDTIQTKFSFTSGIETGDVKGDITVNLKNNDYRLAIGIHKLDRMIKDSLVFTIQEKCVRYINPRIVNEKFNELNNDRQNEFLSYFRNNNVEKRVSFLSSESVIPFNGFSFYKIEYKGEFPITLLKAYRKMNDLNNAEPRKKFKTERSKSGGIF